MKHEHRLRFAVHAPPAPAWFRPQMAEPRPAEVLPSDSSLREEYLDGGETSEQPYPSPLLRQWLLEQSEAIEASSRARQEWDRELERQTLAQWPWAYADLVLGGRVGGTRAIVDLVAEAVRLALSPLEPGAFPKLVPSILVRTPLDSRLRTVGVEAADEGKLVEVVDVLRDAVVDAVVEALSIAGVVRPDAARRSVALARRLRDQSDLRGEASPDVDVEPSTESTPEPAAR